MKAAKYVLLALALAAALLAAGAAYLLLTFDSNDYHARLSALVREKTGRTLSIEGSSRLSFWPDIAVEVGAATLSERNTGEPFASLEGARLTLALRPLLAGAWIAREIAVTGASVRIVRFADGRLNIADLLASDQRTAEIDVGRIVLKRCHVHYSDIANGREWDFSDIGLATGHLKQGIESPVTLTFAMRDNAGAIALESRLEATLTPDFAARKYALERALWDVNGSLATVSDLAAKVAGNVTLDAAASSVGVKQLSLQASRAKSQETVSVDASASELLANAAYVVAKDVNAVLRAGGTAGKTTIGIQANVLERMDDSVSADPARLELRIDRGTGAMIAAARARIDVAFKTRTIRFSDLDADLTATAPKMLAAKVSGRVRGDARLDWAKEDIALKVAGRIDHSAVRAELSAAGFAAPLYNFAIDVDTLDLDRYRRPASGSEAPASPDFAGFAELPASGTLRIGTLTSGATKASDVRFTLSQ